MNTLTLTDDEFRLLNFWAVAGLAVGGIPQWTSSSVVGNLSQKLADCCDGPIEREAAANGEIVTAE